MNGAKLILYGVVVVAFAGAGVLDLCQRQWKLGLVALVFALANGLIFFWR